MSWKCSNPKCGEDMFGKPPPSGLCLPCERARYRPDRRRKLQSAGCPPIYLSTPYVPQPWSVLAGPALDLLSWQGSPGPSTLTILGAIGTGKTMLATEILSRQDGLLICSSAAPMADMLSPLGPPRGTMWASAGILVSQIFAREQLPPVRRASALLLDDLGRGHSPGTSWEPLSDLVAHRYDWQRLTIVTTNLDFNGLFKLDGRLADRLRAGMIVSVSGPSQRGRR